MRYKPGDRVKIKTWDQMKDKYGLAGEGYEVPLIPLKGLCCFTFDLEDEIKGHCSNRIVTIKDITDINAKYEYGVEEITGYTVTEEMIECLYVPVKNRFEIMDLD